VTPLVQLLPIVAKLSLIIFVVTSMIAMGLSLTIKQIVEPMRDTSLVIRALVANFVLVPLAAIAILLILHLSKPLGVGLVLLACSAGAPFLPKLVQMAQGNVAFSVGLMVLLTLGTIAYLPIVLPLLVPGVQVAPASIARSLVLTMVLPLGIGLYGKARSGEISASLQPAMSRASTAALLVVIVLLPVMNLSLLLGALGSGAYLAVLLLIAASFALGYLLGGPSRDARVAVGLGSAQRNVSAALIVGASNFSDPSVLVMIIIGSTLMQGLLLVTAAELGRHEETIHSA
jgi:predicted Na+-dependent transporter